ncbi:sorbitol dehydrogenase [Metschnikowia bicuspidata var. bicuspidata NRRL YB-4993]|uniref:Sorbitol dehydrogenase n=1 Tax=Metschnikowia bicuspidata var. bicuspidata NRRL YB-4993 TaxID=869754 RepID=A0A1A0HI91_9ASCO|nr:sorbitol dehydrogenase [Metschnikowia bicuspidata var. bicuspidata NRRL YB-4993]OBA23602.1 sorbitol dehydrogenase [Metschnikowia bicuspidata var. bicuspidata NRRL YB-4993]
MRAAVIKKPYLVETIEKEVPKISQPTDVLVKVKFSGLCGSDLHYYRGHIPLKENSTMGHEFLGTVVERGSDIKDEDFMIGEDVIATFTIQCGKCWYCQNGYSGTCDQTNTFGKAGLEGGQAEYVLVPFAKTTLVKKPTSNDNIDDSVYVLMADIFVTGYFGVKKIIDHFQDNMERKSIRVLQIGAGPVGLCAVRILKHFGFEHIVVVDGIEDRLNHAKLLGAVETVNFKSETGKLDSLRESITDNRGFDAVLEIVGATSALKTAFFNVRRGGFISSVGMGHDPFPFNALESYVKGLTISFGRCNAWSLFHEALRVFEELKCDLISLIDTKCPINDAKLCYERFERGEVKKVVFTFT